MKTLQFKMTHGLCLMNAIHGCIHAVVYHLRLNLNVLMTHCLFVMSVQLNILQLCQKQHCWNRNISLSITETKHNLLSFLKLCYICVGIIIAKMYRQL